MQLAKQNEGTDFEVCYELLYPKEGLNINLPAVNETVSNLCARSGRDKLGQIASLLNAVTCIDLTTLCGDDTECNVQRLCHKAANPIEPQLLVDLGINAEDFHCGAVCVYPARVSDAVQTLDSLGSKVPVASVAAGFPSGQYHLSTKLEEIRQCVKDGAKEIDIVISRELVLHGKWEVLYNEVKSMKQACGEAHLKTIIAGGELGSLDNVHRASIVSMSAGSDFIKTSTGKEAVNATLLIGMIMTRAIKDYYLKTGFEVGFKPAGGIRTAKDVFLWQDLMRNELGKKWLFPNMFRIGASGLLGDIERNLYKLCYGCAAPQHLFAYQ